MRWVLYSFHKQFATQEEEGGVCLKLLSITAINIEQWKAWTSILILRMLLTAKHDHVFAASMVVLSTVEDEEEADNNTDNMSTNCTTEVYVTLTTAMTTIKLQYTQHSHAYPTLVLANTTYMLYWYMQWDTSTKHTQATIHYTQDKFIQFLPFNGYNRP